MTLIPCKIKDGSPRNSIGQLESIAAKYNMVGSLDHNSSSFLKWCERELSKLPGGLDGLTKTETGYSNQIQLKEVA